MSQKIWLSSLLLVVLLTASIYFIFNDEFKIDIQNTRTQYYVGSSGNWILSATEYVNLYNGTTKMRASSRNLTYWNDSDYAYVKRTSTWKDNITTIQTYTFDKYENQIENVPIRNEFRCLNCEGKIVHYEIRDIKYDGETKNIDSPFSFGNNMSIEFDKSNDFSWAKVYQQLTSDKIVIRYKPDTNDEFYYVRLYDPTTWIDEDNFVVTPSYATSSAGTENGGVSFNSTLNITSANVFKPTICTATNLKLLDGDGNLLTNVSFVGDNATITYPMIRDTNYSLVADKNGASYDYAYNASAGLPKTDRVINFQYGIFNSIKYVNPDWSYNILNITFNFNGSLVTLNSPVDGFYSSSINNTFNATAILVNEVNLTNMSLWTNISGTWEITNTTILSNITTYTATWEVSIDDGNYTWNVEGCSNDGYCGMASQNRTFVIDTTLPIINIIYPINSSYPEYITELNYSLIELYPDKCWYSNDSGVTNYSIQTAGENFTNMISQEGSNTWIVYCNDTLSNENSSSITFYIDATYPQIEFDTATQNNGTALNQTFIYANVSVTELNEENITFSLYYSNGTEINSTTSTSGLREINWTGLGYGTYYYNVTIYDIANNSNSTDTRVIYLTDLQLSIESLFSNVIAELGSNLTTISNSTVNFGQIYFDINHPDYGINYTNNASNLTLSLLIEYFNKTSFNNSLSYYNLTFFEINETTNETDYTTNKFYISSHQYDYIENVSVNISGSLNNGNSSIGPRLVFYNLNSSDIDRAYRGELIGSNIYLNQTFDNNNGTNNYLQETNLSFENYGDKLIYFYLDDNATIKSFLLNFSGFEYGFNFSEDFNDTTYKDEILSNTTHFWRWELPLGSNPLEFLVDGFNDSSINTTLWYVPSSSSSSGGGSDYTETITNTEGTNGLSLTSSISQDFDEGEGDTTIINDYLIVNTTSLLNMVDGNYYTFNISFDGTGTERASTQHCEVWNTIDAGVTEIYTSSSYWTCEDTSGGYCSFTQTGNILVNISKNYSTSQFNYHLSGLTTKSTTELGGCGAYSVVYNWTNGSWSQTSTNCGSANGVVNNSGIFTPTNYLYPITINSYITGDGWNYAETPSCYGDGRTCLLYLNDYCINWYYCSNAGSEAVCEGSWGEGSCTWNPTFSGLKGCSSASNTLTIYDAKQELNNIKNSSYYSLSVFDSSGDINSVDAYAVYNGEISPFISTDDGDNYQTANFSNATNYIVSTGEHVKYYIKILVGEGGYLRNIPYLDYVELNAEKNNASNVSFDFGNDGTYDYTMSGELNSTNSPMTANLTLADISSAFSGSPDVGGHTYLVPLRVFTSTAGIININNINLTYDPNPVILNKTAIINYLSNLSGLGNLSFEVGSINGTLNLTGLNYNYAGGNKTYSILAHSADYLLNVSRNITYYFSQWDYNWGPSNVEWIYFNPKNATAHNVTPYGQTSTIPIINITNLGYGGKNATLSVYLNSTIGCVNTTLSNSSNKTDGFFINSSWNNITTLNYLETSNISLWADYNCSYSNWYLYNPYISFRNCCDGCICSEVI
ncbi:MAG: hypothetical protein ACFFG0_03170 [Candidatus Thorarchaeota archaeon]